MAKVELRQVTKLFGTLTAVDNADLDIADGEVLCLLGPSGCGKTTTLRMIAGLEAASSGDILLGGQRVNDLPTRERNIAMAFQFYALYPNLTVAEQPRLPVARRASECRADPREGRRDRAGAAARPGAGPSPEPARRRREAAGRRGPLHHPRSELLPVRRAAVAAGRRSCARRCAARSSWSCRTCSGRRSSSPTTSSRR